MQMLSSTHNTRAILPDSLRFIRSDVPVFMNQEDIDWLISNNITTIIDLRTVEEQENKPCPLMEMKEFDYYTVSLSGGRDVPASPQLVPISYIDMVDDKLEQVIDIVTNAKSNVLYFCNMGKDRTGVVSAVLLRKLGMSDEYIVNDYIKSYDNVKDILEQYVHKNPDVDINVITPKAEYMRRFLELYD